MKPEWFTFGSARRKALAARDKTDNITGVILAIKNTLVYDIYALRSAYNSLYLKIRTQHEESKELVRTKYDKLLNTLMRNAYIQKDANDLRNKRKIELAKLETPCLTE